MAPSLRRLARSPALRALVAGVLVAFGGPPFPVAVMPLWFLGLVLFALVLDDAPTWKSAALRGFLFGLGMNLAVLSFIPSTIARFTEIPWVAAIAMAALLAAAQSLPYLLAGVVTHFARRIAPLPLAFALGVGVSTFTPQLFAWTLASPLARMPIFLQLADVIGERGVAVAFSIAAAFGARAWIETGRARVRQASFGFAIPIALLIYGFVRAPMIERRIDAAPKRTIALVQHDIPPKERWREGVAPSIVQRLWSLTRDGQAQGADLAVWPEAAYPYILSHQGGLDAGAFRVRGPGVDIDVLTGLLTTVPDEAGAQVGESVDAHDHYNAAVMVGRDGRYSPAAAKIELLPFGEAVPFGERFPALRRMFSRGGSLRAGREVTLLTTLDAPVVRAGVLNCYEDTLPSLAVRVARAGPNLLVNVTNDAWFGETAEPDLHLLAATARTIEARRDLVRAVNTGVTAHVDALGRIVARAPREVPYVLLVRPALLDDPPTIYVRFSDFSWVVPLVFAAATSFFVRRSRARAAVENARSA